MLNIFKYPVDLGEFELELPEGHKILTVQMQGASPFMWAIVDPSKLKVTTKFVIRGTGHEYPSREEEYIGTFQMAGGGLIWHLFKLI